MSENDFDDFARMLDDFAKLRQLPLLEPAAKALFFRAVARYPLDQVLRAIEAHLIDPDEGKYRTMVQPAHIVAQIEGAAANDGRIGADEAWAIALRASDENETVLWTPEIAQALGVAQPVLDAGDKIGGRMAFKNAYDRLVQQARAERRPVAWQPTLGLDPVRREHALRGAVVTGLLPGPTAAALLPPPVESGDARSDEAARENLKKLEAMLGGMTSKRRMAGLEAQAEKARLEKLKRTSQARAGAPAEPLWPKADLRRATEAMQ